MARSGTIEPTWPTKEGATVVEEADLTPPTNTTGTPGTTTGNPTTRIPGTVRDRYNAPDRQIEP